MFRRRWAFAIAGTLAAVVALPVTGAQAEETSACQWTAIDLPLPAGFTNGYVTGSDEHNRFTGFVSNANTSWDQHAVIWENGVPQLIGQLSYKATTPDDIDPSGTVVGAAYDEGISRAVRYHDGAWALLPQMESAQEINRYGIVVGVGITRGQVVVWRPDQPDTPRILTLPGDETAHYTGIDDAGRVFASTSRSKGYVWSSAGTRTQVTPIQPGGGVEIRAITAGTLVGRSWDTAGNTTGVEWDAAGRVVRTFPDSDHVYDVNSGTLAVGTPRSDWNGAAVWDNGEFAGTLTKPAGATRVSSGVITDDGVAAGTYTTATGTRQPATWTCG
jgi:YD repeat-containing protein